MIRLQHPSALVRTVTRRRVLGAGVAGAGILLAACGQSGSATSASKPVLFKEHTVLRYQSYKNPEELAVFQQGVQRWAERVGNVEVQTDIVPQGEYIEKL